MCCRRVCLVEVDHLADRVGGRIDHGHHRATAGVDLHATLAASGSGIDRHSQVRVTDSRLPAVIEPVGVDRLRCRHFGPRARLCETRHTPNAKAMADSSPSPTITPTTIRMIFTALLPEGPAGPGLRPVVRTARLRAPATPAGRAAGGAELYVGRDGRAAPGAKGCRQHSSLSRRNEVEPAIPRCFRRCSSRGERRSALRTSCPDRP